MADSPLIKRLRRRAQEVGSRALDELLSSPSKAEALSTTMKAVQRGRKTIDEQGGRLLSALGFATRDDLDVIQRRLARIRKRLEALVDEFEED